MPDCRKTDTFSCGKEAHLGGRDKPPLKWGLAKRAVEKYFLAAQTL
jgi:hypothetical protein